MKYTNKNKNLVEFWSVQPMSAVDSHVFLSYEEASEACSSWDKEKWDEFERWEAGDSSASPMIESTIEPDGFGGCYQSYTLHPACLSGGIYHYPANTENEEDWRDNPGFHKVRWGNIATARPIRR